jgi:5-methylcytosine-specific restriction endonuclease McrA
MPKAYKLPAPGEPFDPELFKLGQPCKRNHIHADGLTLRLVKSKKCPLCERTDSRERSAHRRATDPAFVERQRIYALENQRRLRQQMSYRLYQRAMSKARKVAQRGGAPVHLSPTQLWRRWCDFDHCCAYCGASGDLEVEHVVPISKGGEHHLGNIVPACHRCNSSKRSRDAWLWYKAQPFYEPWRWHNIESILNKSKPMTEQINLFAS